MSNFIFYLTLRLCRVLLRIFIVLSTTLPRLPITSVSVSIYETLRLVTTIYWSQHNLLSSGPYKLNGFGIPHQSFSVSILAVRFLTLITTVCFRTLLYYIHPLSHNNPYLSRYSNTKIPFSHIVISIYLDRVKNK